MVANEYSLICKKAQSNIASPSRFPSSHVKEKHLPQRVPIIAHSNGPAPHKPQDLPLNSRSLVLKLDKGLLKRLGAGSNAVRQSSVMLDGNVQNHSNPIESTLLQTVFPVGLSRRLHFVRVVSCYHSTSVQVVVYPRVLGPTWLYGPIIDENQAYIFIRQSASVCETTKPGSLLP